MDKTKLIEKIKSQLKELVSSEKKFAEIKAGDLMISSPDEELIVGSEVFTTDEEGNQIPLADGEYILDNGVKIEVVAGKVAELASIEEEAPEVEVEAEEEAKDETEKPAEEEVAAEETEEKVDENAELKARLTKLEEVVEEMAKKFEEVEKEKEEMKREFSKIAEKPSTDKIEVKATEFASIETKKEMVGKPDIASIREKARANR